MRRRGRPGIAPTPWKPMEVDAADLVSFSVGLAALLLGARLLVQGAAALAALVGISPLVVGLTVVAFGTSAPELAVAVRSGITSHGEVAAGSVIGSNIFNVLGVLGLSALIYPVRVAQGLVRLDVPLMVLASLVLLAVALDGSVERLEGLALVAGIVAYTAYAIRASRRETAGVRAEYERAFRSPQGRRSRLLLQVGLVLVGLVLLVIGARWLVDGAARLAMGLGVSELVVGLTVVSVGTSAPELATSVVAALRREPDIAVGNVVGSNLFNILSVLGISAAVAPNGVLVPDPALRFDLPVMIATAVACLPIFFTGSLVARWEGGLFLGFYAAYLLYIVLEATDHAALPLFGAAMVWFVIPLTVLTLVGTAAAAVRERRRARPGDGRRS